MKTKDIYLDLEKNNTKNYIIGEDDLKNEGIVIENIKDVSAQLTYELRYNGIRAYIVMNAGDTFISIHTQVNYGLFLGDYSLEDLEELNMDENDIHLIECDLLTYEDIFEEELFELLNQKGALSPLITKVGSGS